MRRPPKRGETAGIRLRAPSLSLGWRPVSRIRRAPAPSAAALDGTAPRSGIIDLALAVTELNVASKVRVRFLRMEMPRSLPAVLLLLLCSGAVAFRICAFNAQRFAQGKVNKPRVVDILVKILARCDISVLQEVMDAKGKAVPALMNALHQFDDLHSYSSLTSPLLGRGNYQERYVYIYRNQKTQILDYYTYEDLHPDRPDVFAREPFIARFSMANKELPELVLIPQHTMPSKAEAEIDALYDVFLNVQERWATEDMIFLGDFNADCGYVAKKRWKDIRLRQKPGFHWLIGDQADTTVREKTHCAYDRIVIHGERCLDAVVPGSARTFDFPKEFGLSEEEALEDYGEIQDAMKIRSSIALLPPLIFWDILMEDLIWRNNHAGKRFWYDVLQVINMAITYLAFYQYGEISPSNGQSQT